jgi:hypothetical protein
VSQAWPRLASFPLTNALGVFMLWAWGITGFAALVGVAFDYTVPPEWWDALKWVSAYAFAQFAAKRATNGIGTNGAAIPPAK